jgi:hypothetical protein
MTFRLFRVPNLALATLAAIALSPTFLPLNAAESNKVVSRVLLISIDGMHALDFQNCSNGYRVSNMALPIALIWPS